MSQLTFLVMFFFSKEAQDIKIERSRMFKSLVISSENKMGQKYFFIKNVISIWTKAIKLT